ncbi:hypothetical protein KVG88_30060 [Pseudomonas sp. SWRI74]|uniref:LysB family phage lysis regulatory protein n=1 Tax=Pseudomonas azerbaijanoccidentalis TaxID=2842347 RepID=A0ABS6QZV4_9PSED|nr:hypothetical protein [Pseudomonas azerbaijanoccidentalis]MBV4524320.1 hypothetical protein [Pseudomonas azerbaijanoccidentalis]
MISIGWTVGGAGVLVALLSLWSLDHSQMAKEAALRDVATLTEANGTLDAHNKELARVVADRAELQQQITEVSRTTQRLNTALDTQSALISRNLEELKRNDKAIADYLRQPVPVALGLRYARPETTDPAAYRAAAAGVQPSAVSTAGAPAVTAQ